MFLRVGRRGLMVLALIEKQSGLLSMAQIDRPSDAALARLDALRHVAEHDLDLLVESLQMPHLDVVPRQDPARPEQFDQQ